MTEALSQELLEILACPVCKGNLDYKEKANKLFCEKCNHNYEVKEGIPILLPPENKD